VATVPNGITHLFLITNVIAMLTCSTLVIIRKHSDYAVFGLMGVVVTQALGYGLIFDLNFFLRNLSVIGGLLMVLSDSWVRKTKAFAGLPSIDEKDRKMYFQLAGRVLLIFLFIGFVFAGKWSVWRVLVSCLGAIACVMVVVGFKAKFSATLLVVILSVFNLLVNNFWTVGNLALVRTGILLTKALAPRTPPAQGLCQVRFFPDPLHRRRSPSTCQQRPGPVLDRREEEGVLNPPGVCFCYSTSGDEYGGRRVLWALRMKDETALWARVWLQRLGILGASNRLARLTQLRLDLRIYWLCRNGFRPGFNKMMANGACFTNSFF